MPANLSILKRHSFLGNTLRILKKPVDFLGELPKLYGPVIVANFGGKKYFILQHPDYIKHVLVENYKGYYKPGATKLLRLFLGEGLITTNGGVWLKQRRLLQPAFHKQKLANMLNIINNETTLLIKKLDAFPKNTPIDISNEFLKLDISIISKAMFSSSLENEMDTLVKTLDELTGYASKWMKSVIKIPLNWPTASNINFKKNCKVFDSIIYSIIKRRKEYRLNKANPAHGDLLDMLIEYFDEETNQGLSEEDLRDEMTTIFMAGYETISQTLNWIFYHLAKDKKITRKVKMEAVDFVKGQAISINNLQYLKFTKQLIQEALRCYPAIYALVRKPYYDDEINGIKIPASSNVLINIYGMHHHPHYWDTPDDFNPGRFNDAAEAQRIPFVYLPFGGGPRLCIGNNFAMMVMQVVVSRLSLLFEFDVPENYEPEIEPNITMRVKGQLKLIIKEKE